MLALLLAVAMFVLVVDTSLMKLCIASVVRGARGARAGGERAIHEQHPARAAARQPTPEIRDEIMGINTGSRPLALQVALLIPLLAGLIGLFNSSE